MFYHFIQSLIFLPMKLIYPSKVYDKKNLPKGRAVLTPNHTSNIDSLLLVTDMWEKKYFLAKEELFKPKIKGQVLKTMGAIKIARNNADLGAIKKSLEVLKKGKKLIIFPEGTRSKSDEMELRGVKNGAAMIAIKSKSPVVPVWFCSRPHAFKKTRIVIGKPFELSQFYSQRLNEQVLDSASKIISEKIENLKQECEQRFSKRKKK